MATYADAAIAAYQAKRTERLTAAKERLRPLMTDDAGRLVLDPATKTEVAHEDDGLVVLRTLDGSNVHFAVRGTDPVRVVSFVDGQWQRGPEVSTLAEVGAVLAEGA